MWQQVARRAYMFKRTVAIPDEVRLCAASLPAVPTTATAPMVVCMPGQLQRCQGGGDWYDQGHRPPVRPQACHLQRNRAWCVGIAHEIAYKGRAMV